MDENAAVTGADPALSPEQQMNSQCFCVSLDSAELRVALAAELRSDQMMALLEERCPSLFSAMPVFISPRQRATMERVVTAIESVLALPAWRELVLAGAPAVARHTPRAHGVFFGYDFHLNGDQLGLIEINTNAGGAMLNALMARAHRACTMGERELANAAVSGPAFEQHIVDMFRREWHDSGHTRALQSIAIVDTDPENQYLYPEFILFQRLFERHGIRTVVASPEQLRHERNLLWHDDLAIDLVYNRLTDFLLAAPEHAAIYDAYLADEVVVTPHPQAHALYADKRNLALLSDPDVLRDLGVSAEVRATLAEAVLHTRLVLPADADQLWSERRKLFFKPAAGFGGRAAYRGDKLTTRVWQDISAGGYVAQALMQPGARVAGSRANPLTLKFDLRMYVYRGQPQWLAARLYQGQTTNFRTPGGGFAPVYSLPDDASACEGAC